MKVLFLVSHLRSGGAERTVSYLSEYMAKNGYDVTILSISNEIFYSISKDVNLITLGIEPGAKNIVDRFLKATERKLKIVKTVKRVSPDVVICLLPDTAKYILNMHKTGAFKLITSERANHNFVRDTKVAELRKKIFLLSDGIVFQTERAKKWFSSEISSKGIVIHNAVGNELVYKVSTVENRAKRISAVGRLSSQKDYPTLLRAFKSVVKKHPKYELDIYGEGPEEGKLRALSQELGISKKIYFRGVHKDAIVQIADSSCYVLSSIFEGMPNALMEAMAVGLPCISTDCPNGPAELIEDGVNGLLVPVGDVDALADAMLRMIEDEPFAEMCGRNAKGILETHSVEKIASEYMRYIEQVVKKGKLK